MALILLLSDSHLDENSNNEYRWDVFSHIHKILDNYEIRSAWSLGDSWDRKERFSASFVNRLIQKLKDIGSRVPFGILRGNHDTPLDGPAFFEFVNGMIPGVTYVTEPMALGPLLLLPYAPDPITAWQELRFSDFKAAFLHVTVTGAITENGREMTTGQKLPLFPRSIKLYSGDVHVPQQVKNLVYVGAPHVIKFGDMYPCRMLLLDEDTFEIVEEIPIEAMRKRVVAISSLDELGKLQVRAGDQVRVQFSLQSGDIERWGEIERGLGEWAEAAGVTVSGTEFVVSESRSLGDVEVDVAPDTILRQFAAEEGVSDLLLEVGLGLLKESIS